jgi:hypothetical protein
MAQYEVNIGARVKSSDGKKLGSIEKLIVLPDEQHRVTGFILGKGIISESKIVDAALVSATDEQGITLSKTAQEVHELPALVHQQLVQASDDVSYGIGFGTVVAPGTGGQPMLRGDTGGQFAHTGAESFYMPAPIGEVVTENISNIDVNAVLISEGTDVVGSDGKKVGHVDEVFVENRLLTGILVRAGFLLHHDVRIPMSLVAGVAEKHFRLNVTADEAERLSRESAS